MRRSIPAILLLVLALAMFGHRSTREEHRCFLHCHGEPPLVHRGLGWPFVYWERTTRVDPIALVGDALVFGLLACAVGLGAAVIRRRR